MPIIYTYPKLDDPQGNELIVITDVNDKKFTKQITAQAIADLFDCDTCTQYCTSSISSIATPFGSAVASDSCNGTINFTSTGGTMTITGNGGNIINFESLGEGGGMSNWILSDGTNQVNVSNADEVTLGLENNGLIQNSNLPVQPSIINYGVNYTEDDGVTSNVITTAAVGASLVSDDEILYADSTTNQEVKRAKLSELPFCTKSINTINVTVGQSSTVLESDECDGTITLIQGSNVTLTADENTKTVTIASQAGGCPDTISEVAADDSTSSFSGCGNTLSIQGGTGIEVLTNATSNGVVINSTSASGAVSGTFTPILVTKGPAGTDPLTPHPAILAYTLQEASYNVDNYGQVYIDFAFQFTKNAAIDLDGTLGVAVNDNGSVEGLNSLAGLADLKTNINSNAGCDISEVVSINDGGQKAIGWNHAAQGGKLNRYYDGVEDKSTMWFHWLNQSVAGGPLFTDFTVIGGNWTSTNPDAIAHYLSGSFNPILVAGVPEGAIYWKPCNGTDWSYQSPESLPDTITSADAGDVWKSNTCYELTPVAQFNAVPAELPSAIYTKEVAIEGTNCECCNGEYYHYEQCPETECLGFPATFSIEVGNPAVPAVAIGTITVEDDRANTCCYTIMTNENCTSDGTPILLFPNALPNTYETGGNWAGEVVGQNKNPNCDECE